MILSCPMQHIVSSNLSLLTLFRKSPPLVAKFLLCPSQIAFASTMMMSEIYLLLPFLSPRKKIKLFNKICSYICRKKPLCSEVWVLESEIRNIKKLHTATCKCIYKERQQMDTTKREIFIDENSGGTLSKVQLMTKKITHHA